MSLCRLLLMLILSSSPSPLVSFCGIGTPTRVLWGGVAKFQEANLKRLVEISSLLTVLIFFITEVQSQSLEISIKRGKTFVEIYTKLTNKNMRKTQFLRCCTLSSTLTLKDWRNLFFESPCCYFCPTMGGGGGPPRQGGGSGASPPNATSMNINACVFVTICY